MLDPESADLLVGRGQGQTIGLGMGEEGGVEVTAKTPLLAEVHPFGKMLRLQLVPVCPLAVLENGVAGVEVHLLGAGTQLQYHVQIGHQFLRGSGPAGVVAGGLDTAGQGLGGIGVEAPDIVTLPAVQGNGNGFQFGNCRVGVDAQGGIFGFCFCVTHFVTSICIFRLPRAVASMGKAMTFLPVASSVSRFRKAFFAPPPTMYSFS